MTQTTEGTGQGAVPNVYPKLINGVVKGENIKSSNVENSDLKDGSVTTAKIATGAVTLEKIASGATVSVTGGLKSTGEIISVGRIKVKNDFTSSPDTCTLKISGHGDFSPIHLIVAYKKITTATFDTGVIDQVANTNTWYTIESVNSDGEMIEAFITDMSFHTNYRVTMQVRQSDVGDVHLVVECLVPE